MNGENFVMRQQSSASKELSHVWDCDTNTRLYKEREDEFRDENSNNVHISVKLQEAKIDKIIVFLYYKLLFIVPHFHIVLGYLCSFKCDLHRGLLSKVSETEQVDSPVNIFRV